VWCRAFYPPRTYMINFFCLFFKNEALSCLYGRSAPSGPKAACGTRTGAPAYGLVVREAG